MSATPSSEKTGDRLAASRGVLQLVATPIGNLEDVTLRALRALAEADLVFAEDTRRTRTLLDRHGIAARPVSLHAHNESARIERALETLAGGGRVALVSDAGMPLVSDPGERLVAAALEGGHRVESIPGASAVLAALTASGLPTAPFTFVGFPPRKASERRACFARYRGRPETLVLFESPRRLAATLKALAEAIGPRRACVARELTKLHEELAHGELSELAARYAEGARGEVTLVVAGDSHAQDAPEVDAQALEAVLRERVARGESPKTIAADLAPRTGLPKRELYARAVALRAVDELGEGSEPTQ